MIVNPNHVQAVVLLQVRSRKPELLQNPPNWGSHLYHHSESAGSCATTCSTANTTCSNADQQDPLHNHNNNNQNKHNSSLANLKNNNTMVCETQQLVLPTDPGGHHHPHHSAATHVHVSHSSTVVPPPSQALPLQQQQNENGLLGTLGMATMEESSSSIIMMDDATETPQHLEDEDADNDDAAQQGINFLSNLPSLGNDDGQGLANIDHDILEQYVTPIMKALEVMDAESVLELKRTQNKTIGARLKEGVYVEPIHDLVKPPPSMLYSGNQKHDCVRYLHVAEIHDKYSIGIFVFPPHAKIPLHDHPGMCVLSRILYGTLQRTSLDLQRPHAQQQPQQSSGHALPQDSSSSPTQTTKPRSWFQSFFRTQSSFLRSKFNLPQGSRRAQLQESDVLEAPNCTMLFPFEGNLHEFVAGPSGAAVLDVLLPPYNLNEDRDCTFYTIHKDSDQEEDFGGHSNKTSSCWVIPTNQPESFHCLSGHYGDLGVDDEDDEDAELEE